MNTFMSNLKNETNYKYTENGAVAHKSTGSSVYNMFALGGAYRTRSIEDCVFLFKKAYEENPSLALKCLFYLGDCRGGQGERRFFRVCYRWLCQNEEEVAEKNLINIPEYRRWDDLIYSTIDTSLWDKTIDIIKGQLSIDVNSKTPSLLAKWMPSENASSIKTKKAAAALRKGLGISARQYRKVLSELRKRINIVERLMSENRWSEIEFDKIPSIAGLIYKNAFASHDISKRYEEFAKSEDTKVNASTLYPYEVVKKAIHCYTYNCDDDTDRLMIEKYWNNLPDYFEEKKQSDILCVVDTSNSMIWGKPNRVKPIEVAVSLGMYAAEHCGGPFKNHYISFSSRPQLVEFNGVDFVDKVRRCVETNLCSYTNIEATFDLLLKIATDKNTEKKDIPKTLIIISDMEIDHMTTDRIHSSQMQTEMDKIKEKWARAGVECPNLVYWNVSARNDTILDAGPNVSFVSGCSPIIFEMIVRGKTGYDLMIDKLNSDRYSLIEI